METRVSKINFSGIKGAKKERKLLEKSSTRYLGAGCREFESRHSDQKSRIRFCGVWTFLFMIVRLEKSNAARTSAACRRLDGGNSLIERVSPLGPSKGYKKDIATKKPDSIKVFSVFIGKISVIESDVQKRYFSQAGLELS